MPTKNLFPFELPEAPEPYFVAVPPKIAAVMNGGNVEEQKAIKAIAEHYVQKDDVWGFNIPRYFGFNLAEKTKLQESEGLSREDMKRGLKLVQKIAKETEQTPKEVQAAFLRVGAEEEDLPEWILPYVEEFMELEKSSKRTDPRILQYCVLIQRTIPKFSQTNAESLHPRVLEQIADILIQENSPILEEDEGKSQGSKSS